MQTYWETLSQSGATEADVIVYTFSFTHMGVGLNSV